MRGGKRPDGLPVSTALTSQAHRRRTPKKNRRIPTIPTGRFGGRIVHVSAVDTGPRGSESAGFLVAEPGAVAVWNHRHSCLRPCVVCRTQPPPPGGPSALPLLSCYGRSPAPATWVPSHVTNVMTSNIELYLAPTRRPASHGSTPTPPAPSRLRLAPAPSRPTPRGSGSTDHGLCVLHEGPTHPQYPQPSSSSTPPSCSAPKRRQQLRAAGPAPPEKRAVAPAHGRPTPPVS